MTSLRAKIEDEVADDEKSHLNESQSDCENIKFLSSQMMQSSSLIKIQFSKSFLTEKWEFIFLTTQSKSTEKNRNFLWDFFLFFLFSSLFGQLIRSHAIFGRHVYSESLSCSLIDFECYFSRSRLILRPIAVKFTNNVDRVGDKWKKKVFWNLTIATYRNLKVHIACINRRVKYLSPQQSDYRFQLHWLCWFSKSPGELSTKRFANSPANWHSSLVKNR